MKTKRVTRYIAECGRGFWKKQACLSHELICKCWTNPKNKACKTCVHGYMCDEGAGTGEMSYWDCDHPEFVEHSGAPGELDYISVHCSNHVCS